LAVKVPAPTVEGAQEILESPQLTSSKSLEFAEEITNTEDNNQWSSLASFKID